MAGQIFKGGNIMSKEYKIELVIREQNSLVSYDIVVKAERKDKARKIARQYAKDKGYNLVTMAIERYKK